MEKSRPKIILSAAMSIDGKISTKTGDSRLSSSKDLARLHTVRGRVDAILVGKNTVSVDDPLLTVRHAKGKNPTRVVLDSRAGISPRSRIIKTARNVPTIIAVSKRAPQSKLKILEKHGAQVIVAGQDRVDIKQLLRILKKRKVKTVLAEGGGTLNWELVRHGMVDELIVTITPYLVGGKQSVTLVDGEGFSKIADSLRLRIGKITRQKDEIVIHYI